MELVLVGSPRLPSHLPPSCGFEWPLADSAHRHGVKGKSGVGGSLAFHLGFFDLEKRWRKEHY